MGISTHSPSTLTEAAHRDNDPLRGFEFPGRVREAVKYPTLNVGVAAHLCGVAQSTLYEAIARGRVEFPVVKVGGRMRVPTRPLLRMLGLDQLDEPEGE